MSRSIASTITAGILIATAGSAARAGERPWIEVKTPHFVVVTDADEKEARSLGWNFEQARHAVASIWPAVRTEPGRPFVILLLRSQADIGALDWMMQEPVRKSRKMTEMSTPDRDWIALTTDYPVEFALSPDSRRLVEASLPQPMPLWLRSGLLEFFKYFAVTADGVQLGRPLESHVGILHRALPIPLVELMTTDRSHPGRFTADFSSAFSAETWLVIHYLLLGDHQAHRRDFDRLAAALREGTSWEAARQLALGDLGILEKSLASYARQQMLPVATVSTDPTIRPDAFVARKLPRGASAALRAGFVYQVRPAQAQSLMAEALKGDATCVETVEVQALMVDATHRDDDALVAFQRASDLGSQNAYIHYRLATLRRRTAQAWGDVSREEGLKAIRSLETATGLDPDLVGAQAELAAVLTAWDPGERAVVAARTATELAPGMPRYRKILVEALWATGRRQESLAEGDALLAAMTDDAERARLRTWLESLRSPTVAP